jgi:hypothetical protein
MNERIQQLAEQAGFKYIKDEGIGWSGNYNASLPKFAELIVRECVTVLEDVKCMRAVCGVRSGSILKEHFGVKE